MREPYRTDLDISAVGLFCFGLICVPYLFSRIAFSSTNRIVVYVNSYSICSESDNHM